MIVVYILYSISSYGVEKEIGCKISLITEDCVRYYEYKSYRDQCSKRDLPTYVIKKDGVVVYAKEFQKSDLENAKQDALKSLKDFCP